MTESPEGPSPDQKDPARDHRPHWARLHLWQIAALRDIGLIAALFGLVWLVFALRSVTVPVATALILAALFNPVVVHADRDLSIPRSVTTTALVVALLTLGFLFGSFGIPQLVESVRGLVVELPDYAQAVLQLVGLDPSILDREQIMELLPKKLSDLAEAQPMVDRIVGFLGLAASLLGTLAYAVIAGAFTLVLFTWAVARFDDLPDLRRYLPASQREEIWSVLQQCGDAFVGFVRGQILVAIFTTTGFAIGFSVVGVPHALVAALIGGFLSFIPNGQASGWVLAVVFSLLETRGVTPFPWVSVFVWPSLVYAITQSLETFVVTPFVQGQATKLHPLAVLGAVIAGASIGGLLGILLAIPIAASGWIAWRELIGPMLAKLADER
jgi:predicted PurR-regulated permease PerM